MSLNWNAKDVPDFDRKQQDNPEMRNCLIWSSLSIGKGEITEKNLKEWVYRLQCAWKIRQTQIESASAGSESFRSF